MIDNQGLELNRFHKVGLDQLLDFRPDGQFILIIHGPIPLSDGFEPRVIIELMDDDWGDDAWHVAWTPSKKLLEAPQKFSQCFGIFKRESHSYLQDPFGFVDLDLN